MRLAKMQGRLYSQLISLKPYFGYGLWCYFFQQTEEGIHVLLMRSVYNDTWSQDVDSLVFLCSLKGVVYQSSRHKDGALGIEKLQQGLIQAIELQCSHLF